jgi:hypothetical protein
MASPTKRSARENVHNEFFGPYGTALCTVLVPHFVFAVALASTTGGSLSVFPWSWPPYPAEAPLFSWQGLGVVYAWFAAFLLLHKLVPARSRDGVMEADGKRWRYRLNGVLPCCSSQSLSWQSVALQDQVHPCVGERSPLPMHSTTPQEPHRPLLVLVVLFG